MTHPIWAIPGFLGLPRDWDAVGIEEVRGFDPCKLTWKSLSDWGKQFNAWVISQSTLPSILVGYSFGGRLALHALLDHPSLWHAAVIVSAHPGLSSSSERRRRVELDSGWAKRFAHEDWNSLMNAWNSQAVFERDSFRFDRKEEDYDRKMLVQSLTLGSLGHQRDLRTDIKNLQIPILWVTGSLDGRYCTIAEDLAFSHPLSRKVEVAGAGHRVPWEHPCSFCELFRDFCSSTKQIIS